MATCKVCSGKGKVRTTKSEYVVTGCPPGTWETRTVEAWCPCCHGTGKSDGRERVWTETKRTKCAACGGSGKCGHEIWDHYPDGCKIPGTRRICKDSCSACKGRGHFEHEERFWSK